MAKALIVIQKNDHSLGYYGFENGAPIDRVQLDPFPHEAVLSPDRRLLYACHFGVALAEDKGPGGDTVSVVDIGRCARVGTVHCGDWRRPHGIAADAAGRLFVTSEAANRLLVANHPSTGRFDRSIRTGGTGSHIVSVTRDGRRALISNMGTDTVSIVRPDDPERPPTILPSGARPEGSVLDAEENRAYVTNRESGNITVIDLVRETLLDPIGTPAGPVRIAWDRDAHLLVPLYHATALLRLDPQQPAQRQSMTLPGKPVSIGYDDKDHLALVGMLNNQVAIVDLNAMRMVRTVTTQAGPDPVFAVEV